MVRETVPRVVPRVGALYLEVELADDGAPVLFDGVVFELLDVECKLRPVQHACGTTQPQHRRSNTGNNKKNTPKTQRPHGPHAQRDPYIPTQRKQGMICKRPRSIVSSQKKRKKRRLHPATGIIARQVADRRAAGAQGGGGGNGGGGNGGGDDPSDEETGCHDCPDKMQR